MMPCPLALTKLETSHLAVAIQQHVGEPWWHVAKEVHSHRLETPVPMSCAPPTSPIEYIFGHHSHYYSQLPAGWSLERGLPLVSLVVSS